MTGLAIRNTRNAIRHARKAIRNARNAIPKGDSGPFIDFKLGEILKTLKAHQETEQIDYNHKESPLDRQFGITFGRESV